MFSEMNNLWKIIYFIPVVPVYAIISTVNYTFTVYYFLDGEEFDNFKIIMSLFFYLFSIMTIICHTVSMITNPGHVDQNKIRTIVQPPFAETAKTENSTQAADTTIIDELAKKDDLFCKKCNKPRPERSHHCSTCKKCILKMDHHCPWIFNCVGFYNQKAFYLFLFYATIGDLIACVCLIIKTIDPDFMNLIVRPKRRINIYAKWVILEVLQSMKDPILIIIGTTLSFTMVMAIGFLFCYQTYLIMNNMTSIESSRAKKKEDAPYFYKSKLSSLKNVLGFKIGFWFIPIFRPNKYNGGYSYIISDEINIITESENIKKKNCEKKHS